MIDRRTPVIVGVGQLTWPAVPAPEPVDLLAEAARAAAEDSGSARVLERLESIRIVRILSRGYPDPAALLAERIGATPKHRATTSTGGNHPQALVNRTAAEILRGELDVALIGGAESWRTRAWYRKRQEKSPWSVQPADAAPHDVYGKEDEFFHKAETAVGLTDPTQLYAVIENALAAQRGLDPASHLAEITALWSRFSQIAAGNPYAALRTPVPAADLADAGPRNRMICHPYPKLLCSNNSVDQAAAILLCSVEAARALGVAEDRWVFPHSGADAAEPTMSERPSLAASPAIRAAGAAALELAGVGPDDLAHVDLYSCFPSAVQVAATELGLSPDRQLTVTGGLTFAGGPWNNYSTHAIATLVGLVRDDPDAVALCTANGGLLTKHSIGVYSGRPPREGFRAVDLQPEMDRRPRREVAVGYSGPGTVEAFTVEYDRDGAPTRAVVSVLTPDDARAWLATDDPDLVGRLLDGSATGTTIQV